MIASSLRTLQRRGARFFSLVEFSARDPDEREIEREHVFHERIMAGFRYPPRSLESLDGARIVAQLRVQHSEMVQHPGGRLGVPASLESAEAAGRARFG